MQELTTAQLHGAPSQRVFNTCADAGARMAPAVSEPSIFKFHAPADGTGAGQGKRGEELGTSTPDMRRARTGYTNIRQQ
jgi:hypothetical protein